MSMQHTQMRQRLGSVGDSSAPPSSDTSEGSASETFEMIPEWSLNGTGRMGKIATSSTATLTAAAAAAAAATGNGEHQIITTNGYHKYINADTDAASHESLSLENSGTLTDNERGQVESFFSGLGTEIFVSPSLANLYEITGKNDWRLVYTGIPVVLHDKGSARSRTLPRVQLVLAERGSCFALWKDTIDNLSNYKIDGPAFHTMCLSNDHTKIVGFSFDSNHAAREIWTCLERLISNPENISLSAPGRKRKQHTKRPKPPALPPKSQISQPCQFHHVTSVTTDDRKRYFSLQAFVAPPPIKHCGH